MQFDHLKRRDFITLLGAAATWPLAAYAQPDRMRRLGVLMAHAENDPEGQIFVAVVRETLQKLGWVEGRNIRIDTRWAAEVELMPGFAKELVALQPDLILANNTPKSETRDVTTRSRKVRDEAAANRVRNDRENNGNCGCLL